MPLSENSFPKTERLRKEKDFERAYKGKRLSGKAVIFYYTCADSVDCRKVGFTVSKKVSKLAVKRNKIKRRLREIYRLNNAVLPEKILLVIRALPNAADFDFYELKKEVVGFFSVIASCRSGHPGNQNL